jgi:Sulfotransferase family
VTTALDPVDLIAGAEADAGQPIAAPERLTPHLARYLEALSADVPLTPTGAAIQHQKIHGLLVNRARMDADLRAHPEIRDETILPPIVIVGLPRTGSTKLLRMLAEEPELASIPYWWLTNPAPVGPRDPDGRDPRIAIAELGVARLKDAFPDFIAAHPTEAQAPDEEVFALDMTFQSLAGAITLPAPRYQHEVLHQPHDETYDYLRLLLQYRQWQFPEQRDRPLVLKSPVHLAYLPLLLACFPGATIVHCHRDAAVSVPSLCRLFETVWAMCATEIDPRAIGEWVVELWAEVAALSVRHRAGAPSNTTVIDIGFDEIVDRPLDAVTRVLAAHGIERTGVQPVSERWHETPTQRYGPHAYSLERYALDADAVRAQFADYSRLAPL